uniref:Complement factor H like 4 n=1 Tax=Cyprinus carpio carpio TaxID=630221 RepID=A0A9J7XUP5_CYPCA
MESSLAFLCLWICFIVFASTSNGCSEIPVVENAEVSESSKKPQYSDDDTLDYSCVSGHVSPRKIIYKCSNNEWIKLRGDKCTLKPCESPEDIPNGRYIVESGRNFVFGTTIKYICNDGYQIMSRYDTRTCREGGWDNQLPACEEVSCERIAPDGNIRVEGLPDHSEDLIRSGHRLTFSCVDKGLIVRGQKEIICQSNGEWSSPIPTCVEATCLPQWSTTVGHLKIEGLPDIEGPVKPGHRLTFSCTGEGMKLNGQRDITCQSNGEWSSPFPKCQEIACEEEPLTNVEILFGHPVIDSPYKPGHILLFRCIDVNLKLNGRRAIECQSNGEWDYPYPTCREITCEVPRDQHVSRPNYYFSEDMKLGTKTPYRCEPGYRETAAEATCTRDGWTPNPLCAEITCEVPRDQHVSRPNYYFSGDMKLGTKTSYRCESGYRETAAEATCTRDGWTPNPLCAEITCEDPRDQHVSRPNYYFSGDMKLGTKTSYRCESGYRKTAEKATCTQDGWTPNPLCAVPGKCGPPPPVNDGDTVEIRKKEYNTGERVEYMCFNKYTLDLRHPFSRYLTCQQGEWRGNIKCLKPCTVTVEEMNERGIELAFADQQKLFAPHDDHITFTCQRGKILVGFSLRQKCNDGVMTLPKCV